ncbi:response regulator [Candidatus Falkowbacteria bacterium CG11_big_fil_rev_8_21_14_0_20_39_10]|uniref:Response regulator n=1 Tax=Candidatus Falkowbacteria bacterium CG11_big_fil_rev_8_21_14_0_20_39_10 TaxID=1974570 RepID=A0A2M6K9P1_9BACT|nr:MAG: response regulator [Candidatus Falkowbacteria bacterium CG11_big_fil_rev_8_21_14_0_20_39_10]
MPKNSNQKKCRVALVDDEEIILEMYKTKLEKENYEVITARNGLEGLALVKDKNPDIVLVDLMMPKKDGFYLLARMKNNKKLSKIPTIVLTNMDGKDLREKACQLGAIFFLVKAQFMPSEVVEVINEVLNVKADHPEVINRCS